MTRAEGPGDGSLPSARAYDLGYRALGHGTMGTYAFVAPLVPGKVEEWKAFTKELSGARKGEYEASRKFAGITRETVFHQKTPMGDFVVVVIEAPGDASAALRKIFDVSQPFNRWFASRVQELHGITAEQMATMAPNSLQYEWKS